MPGASSLVHVGRLCRHNVCMTILVLTVLVILPAACVGSRELTRDKAAELIRNDEQFRAPESIALKPQPGWAQRVQSADEAQGQATARAVESYTEYFAEVAVLRHLGLVDVKVTVTERPTPTHPFWEFRMEPHLTDEGRKEAAADPASAGRQAIALARKELIEVTGISIPRDGVAQVEYTWRLVPTEAGAAFDTTTPAYKNLPAPLQKLVVRPTSLTRATAERRYDGTKRSTALLRRYDDGWRVQALD